MLYLQSWKKTQYSKVGLRVNFRVSSMEKLMDPGFGLYTWRKRQSLKNTYLESVPEFQSFLPGKDQGRSRSDYILCGWFSAQFPHWSRQWSQNISSIVHPPCLNNLWRFPSENWCCSQFSRVGLCSDLEEPSICLKYLEMLTQFKYILDITWGVHIIWWYNRSSDDNFFLTIFSIR